jgi:epoxyqueuosine reductase
MQDIMKELAAAGLLVRAVPVHHLPELKVDLDELAKTQTINDSLYQELMGFYRFEAPEGMVTVLSVATPVPITRLSFSIDGKKHNTILPPTYAEYSRVNPQIEERLNVLLGRHSYTASWFKWLPQKMLAARSGLAEYGRNNVCYTETAGSFVMLSAFVTDMPCQDDTWRQARRMDSCADCTICLERCPTGAIATGRQVIDASRCLTNLNESHVDAFPQWLDGTAHHCIVGCMRCQAACPKNAALLNNLSEPIDFDDGETALLLENREYDSLPQALQEKLVSVGLKVYYPVLPRNLKALFRN